MTCGVKKAPGPAQRFHHKAEPTHFFKIILDIN